MIEWQYFPKCNKISSGLEAVVRIFESHFESIDSSRNTLFSNGVLQVLQESLSAEGFSVERGSRLEDKISVPVLFGRNGHLEKAFHVDAYQESSGTVIEIEAGRAVTNYQFLKDLFEACMMHNVNFLVIAVRKNYRAKNDFETVLTFFDTLYSSSRIKLPLEGILVIGY